MKRRLTNACIQLAAAGQEHTPGPTIYCPVCDGTAWPRWEWREQETVWRIGIVGEYAAAGAVSLGKSGEREWGEGEVGGGGLGMVLKWKRGRGDAAAKPS